MAWEDENDVGWWGCQGHDDCYDDDNDSPPSSSWARSYSRYVKPSHGEHKDRDGNIIKVSEMSNFHLVNAYNYAMRNGNAAYAERFGKELDRR